MMVAVQTAKEAVYEGGDLVGVLAWVMAAVTAADDMVASMGVVKVEAVKADTLVASRAAIVGGEAVVGAVATKIVPVEVVMVMVAGASMVTVEAMAVMAAETMAVAEVLEIAVVVSAARMVQELEDAEGRDMVDVTGAALETSMKAMQVMQVVAQMALEEVRAVASWVTKNKAKQVESLAANEVQVRALLAPVEGSVAVAGRSGRKAGRLSSV